MPCKCPLTPHDCHATHSCCEDRPLFEQSADPRRCSLGCGLPLHHEGTCAHKECGKVHVPGEPCPVPDDQPLFSGLHPQLTPWYVRLWRFLTFWRPRLSDDALGHVGIDWGIGDETHVICRGCNQEIDPETCGCGSGKDGHGTYDGHGFIPMGCDCHRSPVEAVADAEFERIKDIQARHPLFYWPRMAGKNTLARKLLKPGAIVPLDHIVEFKDCKCGVCGKGLSEVGTLFMVRGITVCGDHWKREVPEITESVVLITAAKAKELGL